jgi:hypothetical protein
MMSTPQVPLPCDYKKQTSLHYTGTYWACSCLLKITLPFLIEIGLLVCLTASRILKHVRYEVNNIIQIGTSNCAKLIAKWYVLSMFVFVENNIAISMD